MQSTREIKRRQKSIGNIGQMAQAMELVSVTKMRRSQHIALLSRPYAKAALTILRNIKQNTDSSRSYFFGGATSFVFGGATSCVGGRASKPLEKEKIAILLITTDKGLCGGLNTNVFRKAEKLLADLIYVGGATSCVGGRASSTIDFIVIGKKGEEWCRRKNFNVIKAFNNFGDYVDVSETTPVSEFLISIFKEKKYDKIFAVYTNFISALKQEAAARKILPLDEKNLQEVIDGIVPQSGKFSELQIPSSNLQSPFDFEYKFEPKAEEILDGILYSLVESQIYYIILENNASEHSARRMAMRNAYESADEMLNSLTLTFNKARQAGITKELSEIASAADI